MAPWRAGPARQALWAARPVKAHRWGWPVQAVLAGRVLRGRRVPLAAAAGPAAAPAAAARQGPGPATPPLWHQERQRLRAAAAAVLATVLATRLAVAMAVAVAVAVAMAVAMAVALPLAAIRMAAAARSSATLAQGGPGSLGGRGGQRRRAAGRGARPAAPPERSGRHGRGAADPVQACPCPTDARSGNPAQHPSAAARQPGGPAWRPGAAARNQRQGVQVAKGTGSCFLSSRCPNTVVRTPLCSSVMKQR